MVYFREPDNIKIRVQTSYLNNHKWEMAVSERSDFVDINAIARALEADVEVLIENAKEYNGVYFPENSINEYNGLLFDSKRDCKQFIEKYIKPWIMLARLQRI